MTEVPEQNTTGWRTDLKGILSGAGGTSATDLGVSKSRENRLKRRRFLKTAAATGTLATGLATGPGIGSAGDPECVEFRVLGQEDHTDYRIEFNDYLDVDMGYDTESTDTKVDDSTVEGTVHDGGRPAPPTRRTAAANAPTRSARGAPPYTITQLTSKPHGILEYHPDSLRRERDPRSNDSRSAWARWFESAPLPHQPGDGSVSRMVAERWSSLSVDRLAGGLPTVSSMGGESDGGGTAK